MAEVERTTRKQSLKMAGAIVGAAVTFNTAFLLLSTYSDSDPAAIGAARLAFGLLTVLVAVMAYMAGFAPRFVGHALAVVVGVASLVAGVAAFFSSIPPVVAFALLGCGLALPLLTWKSLEHSRAAWAFLISVLAVLATVTFFGAPKVRNVLGIGLWYALIIPSLETVAVIALSMIRGEYREAPAKAG
jgi:hypothetical protein